MKLYKAIKKAEKHECYITRAKYLNVGINHVRIKPTNSEKCCIVYKDNKPSAYRWNPTAEDLIAKDWIVVI